MSTIFLAFEKVGENIPKLASGALCKILDKVKQIVIDLSCRTIYILQIFS